MKAFDIYDEIVDEFGNSNSENIIPAAMVVYVDQYSNFSDEEITTYSITRAELASCLTETILFGGTSISAIIWGSANVTAKAVVGIVAKVASRFLGPIGIAYTIWNLTGCLLEADQT